MKTYKHGHPAWYHYLNVVAVSFLFIGTGALLLARNLGYLDPYLFDLLVSWQSLLIFIGVIHLIKGHFLGACSWQLPVYTFCFRKSMNSMEPGLPFTGR
ncbi:MAG: DUF5668 domain-containing protein [Bacteroides sp.]|nr:DUF5668 domain-containing protein [Bacteroides sp.]